MNLKCDDLRSTNFQIRGALDGIEQIKAVTETGFFHSSQSLSSNYDGAVLVSLLSTLNRSWRVYGRVMYIVFQKVSLIVEG